MSQSEFSPAAWQRERERSAIPPSLKRAVPPRLMPGWLEREGILGHCPEIYTNTKWFSLPAGVQSYDYGAVKAITVGGWQLSPCPWSPFLPRPARERHGLWRGGIANPPSFLQAGNSDDTTNVLLSFAGSIASRGLTVTFTLMDDFCGVGLDVVDLHSFCLQSFFFPWFI